MGVNSTAGSVARPGRLRKFGKFLLWTLGVLIVVAIVAHFSWKYSGSGEWKRVGERKGVVVYSMKTPGSTIKKFKAVWKVRSRLSRFTMWASDTNDESMTRYTGLYDLQVIEQTERTGVFAWKQPLVSFLKTREFVIKSDFRQDPKTKKLYYNVVGVPDAIPPNDCCVRIPYMNNRWTLTPLGNGELDVEWYVEMDLGGAVPYFLQNYVHPEGMLTFAPRVERFINKEKFQNAHYDWIEEVEP